MYPFLIGWICAFEIIISHKCEYILYSQMRINVKCSYLHAFVYPFLTSWICAFEMIIPHKCGYSLCTYIIVNVDMFYIDSYLNIHWTYEELWFRKHIFNLWMFFFYMDLLGISGRDVIRKDILGPEKCDRGMLLLRIIYVSRSWMCETTVII